MSFITLKSDGKKENVCVIFSLYVSLKRNILYINYNNIIKLRRDFSVSHFYFLIIRKLTLSRPFQL